MKKPNDHQRIVFLCAAFGVVLCGVFAWLFIVALIEDRAPLP